MYVVREGCLCGLLSHLLVGGGGDVRCNDFGVVGEWYAVHLSEALCVEGLDSVKVLAGEGCGLRAIDDHQNENGVVDTELPV